MSHSQRNAGLIFFAVVLVRLVFHWVTGYVADDAFVTFRYAENIARGLGFVYNEGERVLGAASPLFTLILSLFVVAKLGALYGALLVSVVSSGITAALVYRFAERLRFHSLWAVPVMLYGLWPEGIVAETSGTETAFFTMLVVAGFYYSYARKPYYALAAATLAAVTRPEGLFLVALVLVRSTLLYPHRFLSISLVPALILVPWVLFAEWYFNIPIVQVLGLEQLLTGTINLASASERLVQVLWLDQWHGWVLLVFAVPGLFWLWRAQRAGVIELLWFAGTALYYSLIPLQKVPWEATPLLPIYLLLAGGGLVFVFDRLDWLHEHRGNLVPVISLAIFIGFGGIILGNMNQYRQTQNRQADTHEAIGYYLRANTAENAVVAAEEIGYIGSYSKRTILDLRGLVSPAVAAAADKKCSLVIEKYLPDALVLSTGSSLRHFLEDTAFMARYEMHRDWIFDSRTRYLLFYRKPLPEGAGG